MESAEAEQEADQIRFTHRLEAFSDLVFGFSLSLLATRLEVPTTAAGIVDFPKAAVLAITFALICVMWLKHYRVFRNHFVARRAGVVINFVFLFGIATLPYAFATFLQFPDEPAPFALYFGDVALLAICLNTLRFIGIFQRRAEVDDTIRLQEWRKFLSQILVTVPMTVAVFAVASGRLRWPWAMVGVAVFQALIGGAITATVRRIPQFLSSKRV